MRLVFEEVCRVRGAEFYWIFNMLCRWKEGSDALRGECDHSSWRITWYYCVHFGQALRYVFSIPYCLFRSKHLYTLIWVRASVYRASFVEGGILGGYRLCEWCGAEQLKWMGNFWFPDICVSFMFSWKYISRFMFKQYWWVRDITLTSLGSISYYYC